MKGWRLEWERNSRKSPSLSKEGDSSQELGGGKVSPSQLGMEPRQEKMLGIPMALLCPSFPAKFHFLTFNSWILCPSEATETSYRWKNSGGKAKVPSSKSVNSWILGLTRGIAFSSLCSCSSLKPINTLNPASSPYSWPNKAVRVKCFRKNFPLEVVSCQSFKSTVALSRGAVNANWFWGENMPRL